MDLIVTGRNLEVPGDVQEYMARKLQRVARYLPNITEAQVQVVRESTRSQKDRMVVQATLNHNGTLLRGEERGATIQAAFDLVSDVLDRQAQHYKGRLYKSEQARKGNRAANIREVGTLTPEPGEEALEERPVVRTKRFALQPMTVEEATTRMELLGHTFFLFLNSETGEINLLYTRRDGTYGILQAEVD